MENVRVVENFQAFCDEFKSNSKSQIVAGFSGQVIYSIR